MLLMTRLTNKERILLEALSDGKAHSRQDLIRLLDSDGLMSASTLRVHICSLRKKLPAGEAILPTLVNRKSSYQHVRLLASPYDGRT